MFCKRVEVLLSAQKADYYMISSPENLYYYSGFTGGEGTLLIHQEKHLLFTDSRYTVQAKEEAPDFEVIDVAGQKPIDFLVAEAPAQIGFEGDFISASAYRNLIERLPEAEWVTMDEEILRQRSVKDAGELEKTRRAAQLADAAFAAIIPMLRPGVREKEVALSLEWEMRKNGAKKSSFDMICASGVRSAMPHGVASDKVMEAGDFVTLDFGCFVDGYTSDMTRTVVLGKASAKQKEVYQTVLRAQTEALAGLSAGVTGKAADKIARDIIKNAGYGDCFGHALGHGTGLLIHEAPTLSPRSETVLEPGMLVTVEPGIYIEGFGGVRIEDLVIITQNGYENLTTSKKELLEL